MNLVGVVFVLAAAFIVYLALSLRRVLVDGSYRARAFWTAIGGLSLVGFVAAAYVDTIFGNSPTTSVGVLAEAAVWGFVFIALYGWIASNIDVAIGADFFNRDALGWRGGGKYATLGVIAFAYVFANIPSWWVPQIYGTVWAQDLIELLFLIPTLYGSVVLALTYLRIRDLTIRTYTKWVVLSVLGVFVLIFASTLGPFVVIPGFLVIYFMYRSVGSLAIRTRRLT
jgi:hypothetical protein